jgi:rhodanese-related sulfurtransferase
MNTAAASSADMVAQAIAEVGAVGPVDAAARLHAPELVFVDVRDAAEWALARIPGAVNAPRGMLEFYIDPASSFHLPAFDASAGREYLFYCGSGARAALSARLACEMGLHARCMPGGFRAWQEAALPVERPAVSLGNERNN